MRILDLCGGTGAWSAPYREAGYPVEVVDPVADGRDVRLLQSGKLTGVHGILAAPPCTVFAASGARWPRTDEATREGLAVVDACLRIVLVCRPVWWALENPIGTLSRYVGPPALVFHPWHYGDPWTKRTCLWGVFTAPARAPVVPIRVCPQGSWLQQLPGRSAETKRRRAQTPPGFARAFFRANP